MKLLFFQKDADETVAVPADKIRFMHLEGATNLAIYFEGDDGAAGAVNLTIDTGTGKTVMTSIGNVLAAGGEGLIVIADGTNNLFVDSNITAVAGVTIDA